MLGRGIETDVTDETGIINHDKSAETPQRGFWSHWAAVLKVTQRSKAMTPGQRSRVMTEMTSATRPLRPAVDPALAAFLYLEARLADEARYSEWEALWDDDALVLGADAPGRRPADQLSYINDNRAAHQEPGRPAQHRQPALPDAAVGDAPDRLQHRGRRDQRATP